MAFKRFPVIRRFRFASTISVNSFSTNFDVEIRRTTKRKIINDFQNSCNDLVCFWISSLSIRLILPIAYLIFTKISGNNNDVRRTRMNN